MDKKRSLTRAVLHAVGLTDEALGAMRAAAALARMHAQRHGWRATLAAFIAPEDGR